MHARTMRGLGLSGVCVSLPERKRHKHTFVEFQIDRDLVADLPVHLNVAARISRPREFERVPQRGPPVLEHAGVITKVIRNTQRLPCAHTRWPPNGSNREAHEREHHDRALARRRKRAPPSEVTVSEGCEGLRQFCGGSGGAAAE